MKKLTYTQTIQAAPEKVWQVLWNDDTYRKWTAPFSEGSHAVSDWKEGSEIRFLNGQGSGMLSKIAAKRPNEYMSFQHLGIVKDGVVDTESAEVKSWGRAMENYFLSGKGNQTELKVEMEMDLPPEMLPYFEEKWPLAIEAIRQLSEG